MINEIGQILKRRVESVGFFDRLGGVIVPRFVQVGKKGYYLPIGEDEAGNEVHYVPDSEKAGVGFFMDRGGLMYRAEIQRGRHEYDWGMVFLAWYNCNPYAARSLQTPLFVKCAGALRGDDYKNLYKSLGLLDVQVTAVSLLVDAAKEWQQFGDLATLAQRGLFTPPYETIALAVKGTCQLSTTTGCLSLPHLTQLANNGCTDC